MSQGVVGKSTARFRPELWEVSHRIVAAINAKAAQAGLSERALTAKAGLNRSTARSLKAGSPRQQVIDVVELVALAATVGADPVALFEAALTETLGSRN